MTRRPKSVVRFAIGIAAALIIAAIVYLLVPKSYITVSVAPSTTALSIDGGAARQVTTGQLIIVTSGSHRYSFSRDGFATSTVSLTTGNNQSKEILLVLTAQTKTARNILQNDNAASRAVQERYSGAQEESFEQSADKNYPILNSLPIMSHSLDVYACKSQKYPDDPTKIALCVYSDDPDAARDQLTAILQQKGDTISNYEVIYESPTATVPTVNDR